MRSASNFAVFLPWVSSCGSNGSVASIVSIPSIVLCQSGCFRKVCL